MTKRIHLICTSLGCERDLATNRLKMCRARNHLGKCVEMYLRKTLCRDDSAMTFNRSTC